MQAIQRLIDGWFERERDVQPRQYWARTRDGWDLALYRYQPPRGGHGTPVVLCHGMSSNRWDMDAPGPMSMARWLRRRGYDVWVIELRGAGRSMRPTWWNGKHYAWSFEDYVQHDAPAALRVVLRETGAARVHWVGHSMGGMIAYALLMSPIHHKIASAVTLGSPTMSQVGHPVLDFGVPYRSLLRYVPNRIALGTLARVAAPIAPLLARILRPSIAELGWCPGNADVALLRTLMLIAVDDIPASLLREFARWYDTRVMSDRYGMFDFSAHLERITVPICIIAGSHDGLTPVRDLEEVYRRIASQEKTFRIVGRAHGCARNYSHADLVLGRHASDDVFPIVLEWLETRRAATRRGRRSRRPGRREALRRVESR